MAAGSTSMASFLIAGVPDSFHIYEQFRLEVPSDERGWRAKGVLDLGRNRALEP
jgi:hypothetical protein